MAERSFLERALDWSIRYEGSTRSAALIRIFLPIVIWGRIGDRLLLYKVDHEPELLVATLVFFAATLAMMAGLWSRVAVPLVGATMTYFYIYRGLYSGEEAWRVIQQYWAPAVFIAFTDCGRSFSVDRWRALRKAERAGTPPPAEHGNLMGLRLIAILVSSIYVWGAVDKLDPQFMAGERIDRIWMHLYGSSDYPEGTAWTAAMWILGISTPASELALGIGMFVARARPWMVLLGIVVHSAFYVFLPVSSFSLMMWTCYLAYFPADQIHRGIDRLVGGGAPQRQPSPGA
jgi:hypothetical protein